MTRIPKKLIGVAVAIFLIALLGTTGVAGFGIDAFVAALILTLIATPMAWWIVKS
jgi:hypothetical protein